MNEFVRKHKRLLILVLVSVELVLAFVSTSLVTTATVRADFGAPINADCVISGVRVLGLNDVDGNVVEWSGSSSSTFEVPTGDAITGINITVTSVASFIDAYYLVACDALILDPSGHELLNETVQSVDWVKTGQVDGSNYVAYLNLPNLDILMGDVGVYQVLIVLYYLE